MTSVSIAARASRSGGRALALVTAMGLGMVAAAVSMLTSIWLALNPGFCDSLSAVCERQGITFALYNAALVGANALLLYRLLSGSRRAWTIAVGLVSIGAIADLALQATPFGAWLWPLLLGSHGLFILVIAGTHVLFSIGQLLNLMDRPWYVSLIFDPNFGLVPHWFYAHFLLIQLPILILLWVGRPGRDR